MRDANTGKPVTDLTRTHEVWMHLIATRSDLGTFAHVHPEPTGRPGARGAHGFPNSRQLQAAHGVRAQGRDEQHPRQAHHHHPWSAAADIRAAPGRPAGTVVDEVFALPGRQFGPELDAHFHFHTTGLYQLWAQFRLGNGHVITVPFTVQAH